MNKTDLLKLIEEFEKLSLPINHGAKFGIVVARQWKESDWQAFKASVGEIR